MSTCAYEPHGHGLSSMQHIVKETAIWHAAKACCCTPTHPCDCQLDREDISVLVQGNNLTDGVDDPLLACRRTSQPWTGALPTVLGPTSPRSVSTATCLQ